MNTTKDSLTKTEPNCSPNAYHQLFKDQIVHHACKLSKTEKEQVSQLPSGVSYNVAPNPGQGRSARK